MSDEYTREDLDQDTEFARSRWEAQLGETESFDRWLAEVERAAAEKAWIEGHAAGRDYQGDGWNCDAHDPQEDNPYRAEAYRQERKEQ